MLCFLSQALSTCHYWYICGFYCCDKTHCPKATWRGKGLFHLCLEYNSSCSNILFIFWNKVYFVLLNCSLKYFLILYLKVFCTWTHHWAWPVKCFSNNSSMCQQQMLAECELLWGSIQIDSFKILLVRQLASFGKWHGFSSYDSDLNFSFNAWEVI